MKISNIMIHDRRYGKHEEYLGKELRINFSETGEDNQPVKWVNFLIEEDTSNIEFVSKLRELADIIEKI